MDGGLTGMALGQHPSQETLLTPAQQTAVDHPLAPLMIIAGAGTGKTFTLVSRVAHLINRYNIPPKKVLALTFSEQAAAELKGRILAMGSEGLSAGAGEIAAVTFHSFCYQIVLDFLPQFAEKRLMNTGDGLFMLREHFGELADLKSDLFRQAPFKAIKAFLNFSNRLREELIDVDKLPGLLADSAKQLEKRDDEGWQEMLAQLTDQCHVFTRYQEWKAADGWIDYGDMVYSCWQLLEKNAEVRATVQARFETVVIDEFQDNNYGLNRIVDLITQKHRSVTAVGDDDQCIYSFRGASAFNLSDFRKRYGQHPQFAEVVLDRNFRSTQPILDMANEVMRVSPGRQEKMLHAITPNLTGPKPLLWVGSSDSQASFVATEIAERLEHGYGYDDIAILTRTHKHGSQIIEALKKEQIPITYRRAAFFELPAIRQTLAWCHIVAGSSAAAVGLYRLMEDHAIPSGDPLFHQVWTYLSGQGQKQESSSVSLKAVPGDLGPLIIQVSSLRESAAEMRLTDLIWRIMEINGLFRQHARTGFYEDELATLNLSQFMELASRFDERYGRPDLIRFLRYVDVLQGTSAIEASLPEIDLPDGGVHVMTVHGAKGREFPVVILPFLQSARFPLNFVPPNEVSSPPDHWFSWQLTDRLTPGEQHVEEERRLFYVGMTRAKEHLILTTTPKRRSKFIVNLKDGIMDEKSIPDEERTEPEANDQLRSDLHRRLQRELARKAYPQAHDIIDALRLVDEYEDGAQPDFQNHPLADELRNALAPDAADASARPAARQLRLSASSIDTYETCPLKYRYRHVDAIPAREESAAATFGTIMHRALEQLHDPGGPGFAQPVSDILDTVWRSAGFSYEQEERVHRQEAEALLNDYVERWRDHPPETLAVEATFEFGFDDITIDGRIDRVDLTGDGKLTLVDYKTARKAPPEWEARKAPQLPLYALYVQETRSIAEQTYSGPVEEIDLVYYYIRDENPEVRVHYSTEELQVFKERVSAVADGIRRREFPFNKNDHHCSFCEFKNLLCPAWEQDQL